MNEKELFLLKLEDPAKYNVHMASTALINHFDCVKGVYIDEIADKPFSIDKPYDFRLWRLELHVDESEYPHIGLENPIRDVIENNVPDVYEMDVSEYLFASQSILVIFRTPA